jgi:TRAP-type C4-dicarboxylate transport system permease small subunit
MLDLLNKIEEKFLILNLFIMTAIVFMNVLLRYVFSASLSWVDEAARYMFLWLIWVGADYALANRAHLRITMIPDRMHGKSRIAVECFVLTIWFCFCVFLGYQGIKLVRIVVTQQQLSTAMQINMGWAYACVPCGAIFMAIRIFFDIISVILTGNIPGAGSNDPKKLAEEALEGVTL